MPDVTILGSGSIAGACADVLSRAGFRLRRGFEIEGSDRSPIILGELPAAYATARHILESGRHLLIANPAALSPERLSLLLESRGRAQALFVWSERRYHPAYRFLGGLIEADATWRPRYLRQETLTSEAPTSGFARRLTLEALALALSITGEPATRVLASSANNATRNSPDLISLDVSCRSVEAYLQIGMGEALERRETLLAAAGRKAYIDELNPSTPIRLIEEEHIGARGRSARWLSCPAPTSDELARQQCLAFLHASLESEKAQAEAELWLRSLSALSATEASISVGAAVEVEAKDAEPRLQIIPGLRIDPATSA